jgi:hypothetical protein
MPRSVVVPLALAVSAASPALAQVSFPACESQQEMEQIIQSQGELMPDGCRTITITRVDSPAGQLCVIDIAEDDPSVLGGIAEAAVPTDWWVACADIERP